MEFIRGLRLTELLGERAGEERAQRPELEDQGEITKQALGVIENNLGALPQVSMSEFSGEFESQAYPKTGVRLVSGLV